MPDGFSEPRVCLPGVLAVSALHEYAGFAHHERVAKHYWILFVIASAIVFALVAWMIRRRRGAAIEPVRKES